MSDISSNKIRALDGTSLLVMIELLQHRRTTIVADRMGLTQSAISQTLRRLRTLFDDALFLRRPHGLEPTAFALELEPKIRRIVDLMQESVGPPRAFDPAASQRTVRIAASEYELASLVPRFLALAEEEAVQMRVFGLPLRREEGLARLADGTIDLVLGFYWDAGSEFVTAPLYQEHYEAVMRRGHPLTGRLTSPKAFAQARHLLVTPDGEQRGLVDEALASEGLTRRVVATVPLFLPALASLAVSDLVACLPSRIAALFARQFDLQHQALPFATRSFPVSAVFHKRNANSPMHEWIIRRIESL